MDTGLSRALRFVLIICGALAATSVIILILWLEGTFLPRWIVWDKECAGRIPEGVKAKLERSWLIQDELSFDIDGDGNKDEILLVWKRGSYGKKRPSWVVSDEAGFSQHIFIYSLREDGWHPIWMSSKLPFEAASFEIGSEIPGTGRESLTIKAPDGSVTFWGWLSWGLELLY
ncbi:MAG: hypothetical protein II966_03700 [Lachnospiraceae bacterium]|nr:hypothetical protein [Lachnospiraceae bacterium]